MTFDLHLTTLSAPHYLSADMLQRPLKALREIIDRNASRFSQGAETRVFQNRKEDLIRRLQRRAQSGETFEQATDVIGRERLLLSIYLEYYGRTDAKAWLPAFNNQIAKSILGTNGADWHAGRRRQVALLFFTHFDRLEALPYLSLMLQNAYAGNAFDRSQDMRTWHDRRQVLFSHQGPVNMEKEKKGNETLEQLMRRFAIPSNGRFAEKLRQLALLSAVHAVPLGQSNNVFEQIADMKKERVSGDLLMGSAALKIMVRRVAKEGSRRWSGDWPDWIIRFGCDPRYGRANPAVAQWWGWATHDELMLAQQGITSLTLKFFIDFLRKSLDGTPAAAGFRLRSRFLLALFEGGKIQNARLLLNNAALQALPRQYHDRWMVTQLVRTTDQTSMICLRCSDDIFIIEGTHSFGLRMFHRSFPVRGFWENPQERYNDGDFRISPNDCPVFIRHVQSGKWIDNFFDELRGKFHVEWNDVNI